MKDVKSRLEELRREINAERISQGEILELQSLTAYIDPDDVELLEWAGVPESREVFSSWLDCPSCHLDNLESRGCKPGDSCPRCGEILAVKTLYSHTSEGLEI